MNVTEKEKVVHILNEEQPMQFDLFSAPVEEPMNTPFEQSEDTTERIVHKLEEEVEEENTTPPVEESLFTPEEVMDIEVDFSEVNEVAKEKSISGEAEIDYSAAELLNMEVECEEVILSASSYGQPLDQPQEKENSEKRQMELNFDFEDNHEEKKIIHQLIDEQQTGDKTSVESKVEVEEGLKFEVFQKEDTQAQDSDDFIEEPLMVDEEKYSPLNMTIKQLKKNTGNRKNTWKKTYNHDFITPMYGNVENLENEPAYKRQGLNIDNKPSGDEADISRTSLEVDENGDIKLRSNNSFLHDNVD
jgi:cell division protein FtsZ